MAVAQKTDALADALSDLRDMAKSEDSWSDDFIELVAADYGLNPELVARKFAESFGSAQTIRENYLTAKAHEPTADEIEARVKAKIQSLSKIYQVKPEWTYPLTIGVKHYTVIANKPYQDKPTVYALRHSDLTVIEVVGHKYKRPRLVD